MRKVFVLSSLEGFAQTRDRGVFSSLEKAMDHVQIPKEKWERYEEVNQWGCQRPEEPYYQRPYWITEFILDDDIEIPRLYAIEQRRYA